MMRNARINSSRPSLVGSALCVWDGVLVSI
jgi:hypothetical protein